MGQFSVSRNRRRFARGAVPATAVLVSLSACLDTRRVGFEQTDLPVDHSRISTLALSSEAVFESDSLGVPWRLLVLDGTLVVIDAMGAPAIHLIDAKTGELRTSFGRKGGGPGEFEAPWSLDRMPGRDAEFWVYDAQQYRLTLVDLERVLDERTSVGDRSVQLQTGEPVTGVAWLAPERILAAGFFGAERLGVFDGKGRRLESMGDVPAVRAARVPLMARHHAHQPTLAPHPDRSLVALASRHAGHLEVHRTDGGGSWPAQVPFPFQPTFQVSSRGSGMRSVGETRFGYVDVAANGRQVFGLFSGRTAGEHGRAASQGQFVHVFDWTGAFLFALELDSAVLGIAVDEAARTLYAVRSDPHPGILAYRLPVELALER